MLWNPSRTCIPTWLRESDISLRNSSSADSSSKSSRNRSSTNRSLSSGLTCRASIPASFISRSRLIIRTALRRSCLYASIASLQNCAKYFPSCPPIATTILLVIRNGGGLTYFFLGSSPKMYPKSIWQKRPSGSIITLPRCLSPTPSRYVITAYPARDLLKVSSASCLIPSSLSGSGWCVRRYSPTPLAPLSSSSTAVDGDPSSATINSSTPLLCLVARTSYVVNFKSIPTFFKHLSITLMSWTTSWSCRTSSPFLIIILYLHLFPRRCRRSPMRLLTLSSASAPMIFPSFSAWVLFRFSCAMAWSSASLSSSDGCVIKVTRAGYSADWNIFTFWSSTPTIVT
mmetsp:Transcript_84038/g.238121  ORF Transcript_84038/g.238121 Transcript_84038/m.238121 type:complete len:343 (+) Transcript_84038:441-1469(+)